MPTFVTYEKLHEQGRERGLAAAQLAKLDLVLGRRLDGLRRAHAAGVRIGSGSDLLGPLARHKARELAIKASVLGAHQTRRHGSPEPVHDVDEAYQPTMAELAAPPTATRSTGPT